MLQRKSLLYILMTIFLAFNVFSLGLYDDNGNFNHYVSNSNPSINMTLETPNEPVIVENANLLINGQTNLMQIGDTINLGNSKDYTFNLADFNISELFSTDLIKFNLIAKGYDGKKITPAGDPSEFNIIVDKEKPNLIYPQPNSALNFEIKSKAITFRFSEKIKSYSIKVNGNQVYTYTNTNSFERDYLRSFDYNLDITKVKEGTNTIEITFYDLAGNSNIEQLSLNFRDSDLGISLITKKEDNTLKYFYDKNFLNFFNGTIYTSESKFNFKLKTTKSANCYVSTNLLSFREIYDVSQKELMSSSDKLSHSIELDTVNSKIWVACQNVVYPDDIVYLNTELGISGLINIKRYVTQGLKIETLLPDVIVSSLPFDFNLVTNSKAVCKYSINSKETYLDTINYMSHNKLNQDYGTGSKSFSFECFDLLYNIEKQTKTINFDLEGGVKIVSYSPHYTDRQSTGIILTLSEQAVCKYSSKQEAASNFDTLSELSGAGLQKSFEASGLGLGENNFYLYCEKNGEIWSNKIDVVYDSRGPVISNFTFINNDIESEFVGSTNEISFKFDIESLTPIERYYVSIDLENSSIDEIITSNSAKLTNDFSTASKITIVAQNIISKNSSKLNKMIKFDLDIPTITFNMLGDKMSISCFDMQSGCDLIKYSLAQTSLDCNPQTIYNLSASIDITEANYICAIGIDKVGNIGENQKVISLGFTVKENVTLTEFDNLTFESDVEPEDIDPFIPSSFKPETTGPNTLGIVAALVVFIATLGGSGYYAYRKGYLDEQLKKFGINRNTPASTMSTSITTATNKVKENLTNIAAKIKKKETTKGSYEDHLNKLNKFIDSTMKKGGDVFDNFDKTNKGKVKGYEDTMLNKKSGTMSKQDYDDFYNKTSTDSGSLEKESEQFEKYYKEKNSTKDKTKKE